MVLNPGYPWCFSITELGMFIDRTIMTASGWDCPVLSDGGVMGCPENRTDDLKWMKSNIGNGQWGVLKAKQGPNAFI